MTREITRAQARRLAVEAQLLAEPRPRDLLATIRRLALIQVDLTTAVTPSADLVLWSRLGDAYDPARLDALLDAGEVVEHGMRLRPAEDVALWRAEWEQWPGQEPLDGWQLELEAWVAANDVARTDILEALRADGPLPSDELPDTCAVPWRSSGWNNNRNRARMLDQMVARGEIAIVGRDGRTPVWDLAERVYPETETVPLDEALHIRDTRRLASLGIERPRRAKAPDADVMGVGQAGIPVRIEGVRGAWRADPGALDALAQPFHGRTVLLSPLDRLVFDRKRMVELFDFDYQLEMYKPAAARRFGYWAMPVLDGTDLVGKVDATTVPERGVLRVNAIHEDGAWTASRRRAVHAEVDALAAWLGLETDWTAHSG